ncbi:MAG: OmpA family protein [Flavobacteriaceae bacterium]|nr:OmpA family protein [Flavobacteriaceae bacterium]
MKKVILVFSLVLMTPIGLFSQENNSTESYKTNGLWDNWFVNVGGGASIYFGDTQHDEANILERLTWGATASVGKWITPVYGARLTLQGGQKHTFNEKGAASNPGHKMATGYYLSAHADALLNFTNLVAGYKEDRVYNFIPYLGVGIATDHKKSLDNYLSPVAAVGFLNTFRISEKVALTLDISGQAVQSKFNDARFDTRVGDKIKRTTKGYNRQDWDGIGSATLGISFKLGGKQNFEKAVEVVDNSSLLDELNKQIDELVTENERLRKELEEAKNSKQTITETVIKDIPYPVQFEINKSSIDSASQEVVIYNVAQFLKNNNNTVVEIVGYADKQTGTPTINEELSKKRAQAVEDKLITEYGISKDRIVSSWIGDKVQPYPTNNWNRAVIITVVDSKH